MRNKIVGIFAGFAAIFCICSCTQSLDPNIRQTNHLRQILARNSNCLRRLQKAFQQMLCSQGLQLKQF